MDDVQKPFDAEQFRRDAESYMRTGFPAVLDAVTVDQFAVLPEHVTEVMRLRAANTTDIKDADALRQRLYEYVTLHHLTGLPVTPRTLALQFAPTAKRCGVRFNEDVVVELAAQKRLRLVIRDGNRKAWFNWTVLDEQLSWPGIPGEPHILDSLVDAAT